MAAEPSTKPGTTMATPARHGNGRRNKRPATAHNATGSPACSKATKSHDAPVSASAHDGPRTVHDTDATSSSVHAAASAQRPGREAACHELPDTITATTTTSSHANGSHATANRKQHEAPSHRHQRAERGANATAAIAKKSAMPGVVAVWLTATCHGCSASSPAVSRAVERAASRPAAAAASGTARMPTNANGRRSQSSRCVASTPASNNQRST
jgi:hypothetical protein